MEFDWWDRKQDFNRDMWAGKASLREIWVRIKNLPPGSAFSRQADPDQWRVEHELAAATFDLIAVSGHVQDKATKATPTFERPAERRQRAAAEQERNTRIAEARDRFRRQLAAGGDFDA